MIKIYQKDLEPSFENELKGDVKRSQSDVALIKKMINWESEIRLEVGLGTLITK